MQVNNLKPEFQTAIKYTKKCTDIPRGRPSVIFCFDEADGLKSPVHRDLHFRCLRRALRRQKMANKEEDLFGVLLDTAARYNPYVPPPKPDPHAQFLKEPRLNLDPIFELDTFDLLSQNEDRIKDLTTKIDAGKLYSLGRPLWGVYTTRYMPSHADRHATEKLYGAESWYKLNENVLTSMMAVRVPINILWDHLATTLVADHLRMIYNINNNDERLAMSTIQPSEPILALAAFHEIERWDAKKKILDNMRKQSQLGHIDIGDIGEMAACLTLLYSFDKTQKVFGEPKSVKLTTFIHSLFGKERFENHAHEYKSSYAPDLHDLWENGHVFFTHFTRLDTDVDEHVLRHAWIRGCALITVPNTNHFNLAIPVLIDGTNRIKCLVVRVTNRKDDRMRNSLRDDATHLMKNARESLSRKGVDACALIYMALRTDSAASVAFDLSYASRRKSSTRKARKEEDTGGYVVLACGLDENIYPGLTRNKDGCREIATMLREFLSIKDDVKYSNQTDYQRALSIRRN